ncbi:hypothetical protein PWR05_35735 [Paraburkholderia sp. A2RI-6]|uniref:hypothetical protein n=1 Tax=Paraburkholderia sp. A2RI-6 TaxID=3028371 RepID=UPI003B7F02A3
MEASLGMKGLLIIFGDSISFRSFPNLPELVLLKEARALLASLGVSKLGGESGA